MCPSTHLDDLVGLPCTVDIINPNMPTNASFSELLVDTNPLLHKRFYVLRVKLEDGVPVVHAKEHDAELCWWVIRPNGKRWPIFVDPFNIPKFSQIKWQARVPLQNFKNIKRWAQ